MPSVTIRCYGPLNDFLPIERRQVAFEQAFIGRPAVKDTIEAAGVPHPEIELVLVDGEPVDLGHRIDDGCRVAVYPRFRAAAFQADCRQAGDPDRVPRFVLDGHLGRLARALRMLGFDTRYRSDADDDQLADVAAAEDRILLTRDRALLRRSIVRLGAWIRSDRPRTQLDEVVERFDLARDAKPFTRCIRCNGMLGAASLADVIDELEPLTKRYYTEFSRCAECRTVYWRGSHHRRMAALVDSTIGPAWRDS